MADMTKVATTALTSAAVGFIAKASPLVIAGEATEWITAGAIGAIGLFGAFSARGICEDISIGAINGVTSFLGVKMAEMLKPVAPAPVVTAYSRAPLTAVPKLVGYGNNPGNGSANPDDKLLKPTTGARASMLI